jgi:hypothetical protein
LPTPAMGQLSQQRAWNMRALSALPADAGNAVLFRDGSSAPRRACKLRRSQSGARGGVRRSTEFVARFQSRRAEIQARLAPPPTRNLRRSRLDWNARDPH